MECQKEKVKKLIKLGYGWDIIKAVENEQAKYLKLPIKHKHLKLKVKRL